MRGTNTKNSGLARIMIIPYKKGFLGICLDFNIIEEGEVKEDLEESIKEAVIGYIECVCKNNLDDKLLNRHADKRYWKRFAIAQQISNQ